MLENIRLQKASENKICGNFSNTNTRVIFLQHKNALAGSRKTTEFSKGAWLVSAAVYCASRSNKTTACQLALSVPMEKLPV